MEPRPGSRVWVQGEPVSGSLEPGDYWLIARGPTRVVNTVERFVRERGLIGKTLTISNIPGHAPVTFGLLSCDIHRVTGPGGERSGFDELIIGVRISTAVVICLAIVVGLSVLALSAAGMVFTIGGLLGLIEIRKMTGKAGGAFALTGAIVVVVIVVVLGIVLLKWKPWK